MKELFVLVSALILISPLGVAAQQQFEKDIIKTGSGDLEITFIGHGTLMFAFGGKV